VDPSDFWGQAMRWPRFGQGCEVVGFWRSKIAGREGNHRVRKVSRIQGLWIHHGFSVVSFDMIWPGKKTRR